MDDASSIEESQSEVPHFSIALALVWRDGTVCVAQRRTDADHLPSVWEFPGGKCEDNETPSDCVIREAREELGVQVQITKAHAPIIHQYSQRRVTLHPFSCTVLHGEPQPLHSAALRWLTPHQLNPAEFPSANGQLITELQKG